MRPRRCIVIEAGRARFAGLGRALTRDATAGGTRSGGRGGMRRQLETRGTRSGIAHTSGSLPKDARQRTLSPGQTAITVRTPYEVPKGSDLTG